MNNSGIGITMRGFYKVAIVDTHGDEVWRMNDWHKNLILNTGMDAIALLNFSTVTQNAMAGTGDRDNYISSGDSQASCIDGMVYLSPGMTGLQNFSGSITNGHSASLFSGDVIKFNDGTEVMATGSRLFQPVLGDVSASINSNVTVATQSFTIWKTAQLGLHREYRRAGASIGTSSFLNGYCGTTASHADGTVTHWRTYDFGMEGSPVSYTELGVGWIPTAQNSQSVFSRFKLPFSVSLETDQRLRLIHQFVVSFSPTASVFTPNAPFTGWPVAPSTNTNVTQSIQLFALGGYPGSLSNISTTGTSENTDAASLEPCSSGTACYFWASTNSQSLKPFGAEPVYRDQNATMWTTDKSPTLVGYVSSSYERYKYATFTLNEMNTGSIRSMGFGNRQVSTGYGVHAESNGCAFAMVFDQPQTKLNTQTMTISFRWTWSRVLQ